MSAKVSVVVPIYKVEEYLHRCIDSICEQTYPNLEIILVNDGSPDRSGKIIDEYAAKDPRIISIHKENGGLSDARNAGMEYVSGEFILFVDSDDWLQRHMIRTLVNTASLYKADIVQSAFYYAYKDHLLSDSRFYSKDDAPTILTNKQLMAELVRNDKVKNFAWGKLYKRQLIQNIPFKKGVLFEDVFWAHHVMQQVETYVMVHEPLCYYYQRENSIVSNYTPKNLDILDGLKERHQFVEQYYPELQAESYKLILQTALIHYNLLVMKGRKDKADIRKKEIYAYIKENIPQFKKAVNLDVALKRQLTLFTIHPYLNICFLVIRKILGKVRILQQPPRMERMNTRSHFKEGDEVNESIG
ncbi:glycosyltransferase family 2 protein [Bacillus sp. SD088]|uniref:glycosyltransferase family 2 protein n=1 Tax=Bacillus sp. SD088 TaxID=2782012 RepID=UPI001A957330|nr:glycosyltransferase family 2 protein [Bacillus sp. SD088]MBO0992541.1 glycosyltransferase [Bacillus sp. SD088]